MKRVIFSVLLFLLMTQSLVNNSNSEALPSFWYKGPYFIYVNPTEMHIIVETSVGVDNDFNHRRLHFYDYGTCNEPNWGYEYRDISVHLDEDRRVWYMWANNLTPGCTYKVEFTSRLTWASDWSSIYGSFKAGEEGNVSVTGFYAWGDNKFLGSTNDNGKNMNKVAHQIHMHGGKKNFLLNTGDLVYKGGYDLHDADYWYGFFIGDDIRRLLSIIPMLTTAGNHDVQNGEGYSGGSSFYYNRYFPYAGIDNGSGFDIYYHRKYGPFHIYSLTSYPMDTDNYCSDYNANYRPKTDTDHGPGTGQYEWLESELKKTQDDPQQWKIVMMHAPIYAPDACNNQKDAKKYLVPLFEKYGVDVFLSGHNHYYARKTVNDIPYLILGGGGAGLSLSDECKADRHCKGFDMVLNKHHFAYFQTAGDKLGVEIIDDSGNLIDKFGIDQTPKADFVFTPEEGGPPPHTVTFTDTSKGNQYLYQWDYGDGTGSAPTEGRNVSAEKTYTTSGIYTVKLTVMSVYDSDTKTLTGIIDTTNVPDFSAEPLVLNIQETVTFTDRSLGDVKKWLWDFGDGNTSTERNPVHQYSKNGIFSVKLTINEDSDGTGTRSKTKNAYIKVKPYADFDYHMTGSCSAPCGGFPLFWTCPPCSYTGPYLSEFFDNSGGDLLTYSWTFGDGNTSTEKDPIHTYSTHGEKAVLTVSNGQDSDSRSKYIELGSGLPVLERLDGNLLQIKLNNVFYLGQTYQVTLQSLDSSDHTLFSVVEGSIDKGNDLSAIEATLSECELSLHIPAIYFAGLNYNLQFRFVEQGVHEFLWEIEYMEENQ